MFLDRLEERRRLDGLLERARRGESGALVLRGPVGIGKTALLDYAAGNASGFRVERAIGIEAERELAYAGLHQLCAPLLEARFNLPRQQEQALSAAFGIGPGSRPEPFLVGLSLLGLFAEVAHEGPLLCLVDDAQWLDHASAQVLGIIARRLRAESVALVLGIREAVGSELLPEVAGVPDLVLGGLPEADARQLLEATYRGPTDTPVLERIIAEAHGNPLAIVELPRGFTPLELTGFATDSIPLPHRIEESFRRQAAALSPTALQVLLVTAAEPVGDPVLVFKAADLLGIGVGMEVLKTTQIAELISFGAGVRFRHPLLRSVIYQAASPQQRQRVHAALAEVVDADIDPDRRAWHMAQAAVDRDEEIAAELERRAGRAQDRGGLAAAGAFFERAAELTPDPPRRGQRALAAAQANLAAGRPEAALRLSVLAEAGPLGQFQRAQADLIRARLEYAMQRGSEAPLLLLRAGTRLEQMDPRMARDTYLDAFRAAWYAGDLASGTSLGDIAATVRRLHTAVTSPGPADMLLDGLVARYADGYAAAAPALKSAVAAFDTPDLSVEEGLRWLWFASWAAVDLCDAEKADGLTRRFVETARESGALAILPMALTTRIVVLIYQGDLTAAAVLVEQLHAIAEATQIQASPYTAQLLAAWKSQEAKVEELVALTTADAQRRGEGIAPLSAGWMQAVLFNSLGRYESAISAARGVTEHPQEMGILTWSALFELVVASARLGRYESAEHEFELLRPITQANGTDWALGLEACCRALIAEGQADSSVQGVARHYDQALTYLERSRVLGLLARTHLHFGEWLRRQARTSEARDHLRSAFEMFSAMGMDGFAGLAERELAATGESVRMPEPPTPSVLTAQETQIVALVGEGLSNAEVADRLFISPRTVEWHLRHVFAKLQITSRRQLRR